MLLRPRCLLNRSAARSFSTTSHRHNNPSRTDLDKILPASAPPPPPYPYGLNRWYKQANHGLYGGAVIQFGNNVSKKHEVKTPRTWAPNIKFKHIYSRALGRNIRTRVSTRVLRTIDKVGGLDEYVLGKSSARVKELGPEGWKLRWIVLNAPSMKKRLKREEPLRRMLEGTEDSNHVYAQARRAKLQKVPADEIGEDVFEEDEYEEWEDTQGPESMGTSHMREASEVPLQVPLYRRAWYAVTPWKRR